MNLKINTNKLKQLIATFGTLAVIMGTPVLAGNVVTSGTNIRNDNKRVETDAKYSTTNVDDKKEEKVRGIFDEITDRYNYLADVVYNNYKSMTKEESMANLIVELSFTKSYANQLATESFKNDSTVTSMVNDYVNAKNNEIAIAFCNYLGVNYNDYSKYMSNYKLEFNTANATGKRILVYKSGSLDTIYNYKETPTITNDIVLYSGYSWGTSTNNSKAHVEKNFKMAKVANKATADTFKKAQKETSSSYNMMLDCITKGDYNRNKSDETIIALLGDGNSVYNTIYDKYKNTLEKNAFTLLSHDMSAKRADTLQYAINRSGSITSDSIRNFMSKFTVTRATNVNTASGTIAYNLYSVVNGATDYNTATLWPMEQGKIPALSTLLAGKSSNGITNKPGSGQVIINIGKDGKVTIENGGMIIETPNGSYNQDSFVTDKDGNLVTDSNGDPYTKEDLEDEGYEAGESEIVWQR